MRDQDVPPIPVCWPVAIRSAYDCLVVEARRQWASQMSSRITERFRRRIMRSEPPPYHKRAVVFVSTLALGLFLLLLMAGNSLAAALVGAVAIGVPAGLTIAWILPIRIRQR